MSTNLIYQEKVEQFVQILLEKYTKRIDLYEPLSKILPYYWNSIFLSAVKQVMFKRVIILPNVYLPTRKYAWIVVNPKRGIAQIASDIIEHERALKKMIYRKNDWGDPYYYERKNPIKRLYMSEPVPEPCMFSPADFKYKDIDENGVVHIISLMDFKRIYMESFLRLGLSDARCDELLETIYSTIRDVYASGIEYGFEEGVKAVKTSKLAFTENQLDQLVDIYNNIELATDQLKQIIDKA